MLNSGGKETFTTHTRARAFNCKRWVFCFCLHQGLLWN